MRLVAASVGLIAFFLFGSAGANAAPQFVPSIKIPTVKISDLNTTTEQYGDDKGKGSQAFITVPWIANYVGGVYEYAIGVALTLAGVMVVIGGFQYQTAGGDSSKVSAAKQRITDALIGALLVLGSYVILNTVNTDLTSLSPIRIPTVKGLPFHVEKISPQVFEKATGAPPPPRGEIFKMVHDVAVEQKVDPCIATEIVKGESGGVPNAIGHDENFLGTGVGSRIRFFKSGTKYSGAKIDCSGDKNPKCVNDDSPKADTMVPPNYGLDPRFTHGIGITQLTIGAVRNEKTCPDGNMGIPFTSSDCLTVPDLLDPRKSITASIKYLMKPMLANCGGNPQCLFYRYAGNGCSARMSACIKTKYYSSCSGKGNSELSNCFTWTEIYTPKKDDSPDVVKKKRKCCSKVKWSDTVPNTDIESCGN